MGGSPLRGQVIGDARHYQPGVPAARPAPPPQDKPAQDATIFVTPGAEPGSKPFNPVVGWLVVTRGPGRGEFRPIRYGQNSIGRDANQRISFDFGDHKISRDTHAFLVYDEVVRKFFLRDNGKSNLVRLNGNLVMAPSEIHDRDVISIGDTTLLFVALCNANFDWQAADESDKA